MRYRTVTHSCLSVSKISLQDVITYVRNMCMHKSLLARKRLWRTSELYSVSTKRITRLGQVNERRHIFRFVKAPGWSLQLSLFDDIICEKTHTKTFCLPFSNKKIYPQNDICDSAYLQNNTKIFLLLERSINSCKINDKIMRKDGLKGRFHIKLII